LINANVDQDLIGTRINSIVESIVVKFGMQKRE